MSTADVISGIPSALVGMSNSAVECPASPARTTSSTSVSGTVKSVPVIDDFSVVSL